MKKGSKPLIFSVLFLLVVYSMLALGYVAVRQECERLTKEKVENQKMLDSKLTKQVKLIADVQSNSSEERIVKIATKELGMVRRTEPEILLKVSKEKINDVKEALKEKYE